MIPIDDTAISSNVEFVCRNPQNRAGVRLLLACCLAKSHKPNLDIRKPYTEIGWFRLLFRPDIR